MSLDGMPAEESNEELFEDHSNNNPTVKSTGSSEYTDGDSEDDQLSDSDSSEREVTATTGGRQSRRSKEEHNRLLLYEDLTETQSECINFAMEHRIFLRALLGLLNERDKTATETGMNDPNILKCGPLKKASHLLTGVWKVKFVEVRRGMFSYFEDAVSGDKTLSATLLQKNVPLDSNETTCRAVKIHRNGLNMVPGAIFELKVGNTGRLWLARNRAERQAWIDAINDAMVGGSVTHGSSNAHGKSGTVNFRSPFRDDLRLYLKIKSSLKSAKSKKEYVTALGGLGGGKPLTIPVRWIVEQMAHPTGRNGRTAGNVPNGGTAFLETSMKSGMEQLWRDLSRDSICINQELLLGDSGHGPEKIIGALTREIVATSRSESDYRYAIPESRAVAYARDVLLSINRTRSGGDSYFCIDTLSSNSELVVVVPSSRQATPLSIKVEFDESDNFAEYSANDKTGWIRTRNRLQLNWRKRFFVLSEGTLFFYRHASPKPHVMRGQTVVTDATISVDKAKDIPGYYVISIVPKDGIMERFLYFDNVDKLLSWAYALECVANASYGKVRFGRRGPRDNTPHAENGHPIESAMKNHVAALGLGSEDVEDRLARLSARTCSRVLISVEACTEYNVCTIDPQGDEGDTWATLNATFLQRFRITGGRIVRGEEIVQLVGHAGAITDEITDDAAQVQPRSLRKLGRKRTSI
jgi:hypothetical protein